MSTSNVDDNKSLTPSSQYALWLKSLKERVRSSQLKAAVQVNAELLKLYWEMGKEIVELQTDSSWGAGFIAQLSKDLTAEFKGMQGFSERNLAYIKQFYLRYSSPSLQQAVAKIGANGVKDDSPILQQPVAKIEANYEVGDGSIWQQAATELPTILLSIPWGHQTVLLNKVKEANDALFYMQQTVKNNWSRTILLYHIETKLIERQGQSTNNFELTLPAHNSCLATETFKNPYTFDFLTIGPEAKEREIENALIIHLKNFLLELGQGFAFVGRQQMLDVAGDAFFPDLLFYHTKLHCYVVFELKKGAFKPEHLGQLSFYCTVLNEQMKGPLDGETIGVLLCQETNKLVVEYALKGVKNPLGVSEYNFTKALPADLVDQLPSIAALETELTQIEFAQKK